jgi:hypothetical protein
LLEGFKTYQQTTEWSCGNAAALMVLWHFGETGYEERELAKRMGTNPLPADGAPAEGVLYGTTAAGLAGFFREIGYETASSIEQPAPANPYKFRDWVMEYLRKNTPIMVDWLDWGGHWQIIIGYDTMGTTTVYDDVLILADPYDVGDHWQDGYYIFPAYRFYYMWRDPFFQPAGHKEKQWVAARPAA